MKKKSIPTYHEDLIRHLKDVRYAQAYLNATLEDDDRRVFLLALRDVAEAHGGMTKLARHTHISREHIYRMLSEKGNPELATLKNLLSAVGFRLAIETNTPHKKAA